MPDFLSSAGRSGCAVFAGSPAEFGAFIATETEKWAKVLKFAGIKQD